MAFGRGSMTKEMFGNRQPGRNRGKPGMAPSKPQPMPVAPPPAGMAPSKPRPMPVAPPPAGMAPSKPQLMDAPGKMKSGGKVGRGDGAAIKGKTKGAMC